MPDHLTYDVYCDGGVIGRNPSAYGGTWAWTLVNSAGKRLECDSGVVEPKTWGLQKITNNFTELYAALQALQAMPKGWQGFLWTDSRITYYRLTSSNKFNGIPEDLQQLCIKLRMIRTWTIMHLGGHPTRSDLEVGYDERGLPVSIYNVWCDKECKRQAKLFLGRLACRGK